MRIGILCIGLAVVIVLLLFKEHADIAKLRESGKFGSFKVTEIVAASSKRGSVQYSAKGLLDGKPAWFLFSQSVREGVRYPVVFNPSNFQVPAFCDFYVGNKEESAWDVFVRNRKPDWLWTSIGFAAFMLVSGVCFIIGAFRRRKDFTKD